MKEQSGCKGTDSEYRKKITVHTLDSFGDGITFGQHASDPLLHPLEAYRLSLEDNLRGKTLRRRYAVDKDSSLQVMEQKLQRLSRQGVLNSAEVFFGTIADPFYPFEGRFDNSLRMLELFRRYPPAMLHLQTRSPLLVVALPILKALGPRLSVTVAIESNLEGSLRRYTPGLPLFEERLKLVRALRRFAITVSVQVAPVLPYGDWRSDASRFAKLLVETADHIFVAPLNDGSSQSDRRIARTPLATKLAEDRRFHWLRPDAAEPLLSAIRELALEKLSPPERPQLKVRQLSLSLGA